MKFLDLLLEQINEEAWKKRSDAQDYCDTLKDVYGIKCKPVQVDKKWDYWQVEYVDQNKMTEDQKEPEEEKKEIKEDSTAEQVAKKAKVSINTVDNAVNFPEKVTIDMYFILLNAIGIQIEVKPKVIKQQEKNETAS